MLYELLLARCLTLLGWLSPSAGMCAGIRPVTACCSVLLLIVSLRLSVGGTSTSLSAKS